MDEQQQFIDIKGAFRRRKLGFIIIFILILSIAVTTAFVLPPIYRSSTTILVEGQQIPPEYVRTTVTSYVEERLQIITQQVMSRTRLLEIIEQFNLYAEMRKKNTIEEIIEKMRKDINLKTISANVREGSGRSGSGTIAFTLSYEGRQPGTVQRVANVLASLYIEENVKARGKRAETTTEYLEAELKHVKAEIDAMEKKISQFKIEYAGVLPQNSQTNRQALERLISERDGIEMQIRSLEERQIFLQNQLAQMDPRAPVITEGGERVAGPAERLNYLRLQLVALQAKYSEKHPDVKRLKSEIKELEAQLQQTGDSAEKTERLTQLQAELAELQAKYGPKHPDVLNKSKEVQTLTDELQKTASGTSGAALAAAAPENPAYMSLKTQIAAIGMEINNLRAERERLREKIEVYQQRVEQGPLIEREYIDLTRNYDHLRARYNDIMSKLMEARAAQSLEESQRSERFTIIEAANVPEKPFKPNRMAIVMVGLVLAVGAGAGYAAGREALDHSIKSVDELSALMGLPVLSAVSLIVTDEERRGRRIKLMVLGVGCLGLVVAAVVLVHFFYMPLDILWLKVQKRIAMLGP